MKKFVITFVLIVAALVMSACSGGVNDPLGVTAQPTYTALPTYTPYPTQPAPTAQPPAPPAPAAVQPTAAPAVAQLPTAPAMTGSCSFAAPGNPEAMPKILIDNAPDNTWFHRVFNPSLFVAPNWNGADSWFFAYAIGPNSGGSWISHGNPGEFMYRQNMVSASWCLGVTTNGTMKEQFMSGPRPAENAAINVRVLPNTVVHVTTANGSPVSQATSDGGDITIIVPDNGTITISTSFTTAAPTFESFVWVGPYDRSQFINTIDAR